MARPNVWGFLSSAVNNYTDQHHAPDFPAAVLVYAYDISNPFSSKEYVLVIGVASAVVAVTA